MMQDDELDPDEILGDDEPLYVSDFLKDALEASKTRPTAQDKLDYSSFREESKEGWQDYAEGDTFPQQLESLIKSAILLPRQEFQLKIATAYLMLPSALCNRVPILFSQGQSGCGKSTLGFIACALHDVPPISAGSTFASIRNTIQTARVWDAKAPLEQPGNERHCALIWEDIKPEDLNAADGNIFSLLKNGTERSGTITIAQLGGENLRFKVFSPKLISSIHPIYARHEFRELVRRLIIIQHKPISHWSADDFCVSTHGKDGSELIDLQDVDWDGFKREFREYWEDKERLAVWSSTQRSLARLKSHGISDGLYKMSRDLICTGIVSGIWESRDAAITHVRAYWQWHRDSIESQATATQKALARFIQQATEATAKQNASLIGTSLEWMVKPLAIDAKQLKLHCEFLAAHGQLDTNPTIREINASMNSLGWELRPDATGNNVWQLINA